ncbi:MAG: hypothetical protein C9356_10610 [Oleiphilus sp.]|nr:MAG: hypothetical protein C9356_10610 [Oleiphilus sp.]
MVNSGETWSGYGKLLQDMNQALDSRRKHIILAAAQSFEKLTVATMTGSELSKVQDQAFSKLLDVSRFVGAYTRIIEDLDAPRFEIPLEDFKGVI